MKNLFTQIQKNLPIACVIIVFITAGFLHGVNMFKFPYIESDEGTYLSQAWSVEKEGELTPYTYWYDHPPVGWYVIGAWFDLLGDDWNTFGSSINTGRFFMFLLHLVQVGLVMFVTKKFTKSTYLAALSGILFTVSPLAVYFQRRVLLDNIMVTWLLGSVAMLFKDKVTLRDVTASGVMFGFAVMTKVTSVMFGPAFLYLLLTSKTIKVKKNFRTFGWLASAGIVAVLWIVYAIIKTEFIAPSDGSRVSLLGTLSYQASRGQGVPFWHPDSTFMENIGSWMILDNIFLIYLGVAVVLGLAVMLFEKRYRFFGLATVLYFYFLIRGGVVIGFYILPLIPFAVWSTIAFLKSLVDSLPSRATKALLVVMLLAVTTVGFVNEYPNRIKRYLTADETSNQLAAVRWIKENLPEDSRIISDVYAMNELRDPEFVNEKVFNNADWYFKIAKDPAVRYEKYNDNWRSFDYVFISHEMVYQSGLHDLPVVADAIRNSEPVVVWREGSDAYIDINRLRSTNGDWAAVYRINGTTRTQLKHAWNYYKQNYLFSYGQVIDPENEVTTSEGQSYAMLRAVLINDEETFKGAWAWTQDHLQFRLDDKLISWLWKDDAQLDSNNATDADLDIALSLAMASRLFDNQQYLEDAKEIIDSIWEETVVNINGRYYLLPTEKKSSERGNWYLLNPSYFSPAHYRIFAEIDTERRQEWLKLANDTYISLNSISRWARSRNGLVPNWVMVHRNTGELQSAANYISNSPGSFGFDAFRIVWRVGLDYEWFPNDRAEEYLDKVANFFEEEWDERKSFRAIYSTTGTRQVSYSSDAFTAGVLSGIKRFLPSEKASEMYQELLASIYVSDEENNLSYWGDKDNYYNANWTWFGVALYNDEFRNIWQEYE